MPSIRPAAVAGRFYPAEAVALRAELAHCFEQAAVPAPNPLQARQAPKLLLVPHAGYVYSGPVAASAYATLAAARDHIQRVVLLGPAHQVPVQGLAAPSVAAFDTPLGEVAIDTEALDALQDLPQLERSDAAHAYEHSLEVQLPFLQQALGPGFALVPLVVGDATPAEVAEVLERLWGGPETLIVISSDLSHYEAYADACRHDRRTIDRVLAFDSHLGTRDACGAHPLNGALQVAARHGLQAQLLDLRNSGDTAGDKRHVVGYAAVAFRIPTEATTVDDDPTLGAAVLAVARNAIADRLGQALVDEPPHPALDHPGASFVTLRDAAGELRGCIGHIEPEYVLRDDLRSNARAAAFRDRRFNPISAHDWPGLCIEVSLLGRLQPLHAHSLTELYGALQPHVDGLVVRWRSHQATFLPQVWRHLPTPETFCDALWNKADLQPGFWSREMELHRFAVHHYADPDFGDDL
jgi:AmmeMemoRadiSam system protein B/AmmeMemoRadiSam system protein A